MLRKLIATMLMMLLILGQCVLVDAQGAANHLPRTPIQHLIVIVGENRTFDHLFATYQPREGQSMMNLLSQGIINSDGTPGPHFDKARQWQAEASDHYSIQPTRTAPFASLPQPNTNHALGQTPNIADTRFPANLPNGPFPLSKYAPYQLSYTGDPVHRFFQMWQQFDEGRLDLFPWVGVIIGTGSNGDAPLTPFTDQSTRQGGVAMGFYNMTHGDAPVFKFIADNYATGDNYHQGIMGGTGADFIYLGTGDVAFYNDGNGNPQRPPENQIENPNPKGANNWYQQDGYQGGTYVNCSDDAQPGVAPIHEYLKSMGIPPRCEPDHFYLVNNFGPAYNADGSLIDVKQRPFTLPPQTIPNIGEALSKAGVSWKYYIGGFQQGTPDDEWCAICNPLQFSKGVMTTALRANIKGMGAFYADTAAGALPAVAFVRPHESYSGHPADSAASAYEYFLMSVVNATMKNRALFDDSAIVITFDEGGGYYDSGYIETLDFFGDGTRVPLLVVSPWAAAGHIDHTYYDHGSILKFIEANWSLPPMSSRSRDNFPNPIAAKESPYVPTNRPAIGDLMGMFDFKHKRKSTPLIIPDGI